MDTPTLHRTLIVANRTASTPLLLQEVERRAAERPTAFVLLIPNVSSRTSGDWTLEAALTLLRRAAGSPGAAREAQVEGLVGGADPFTSVKEALAADRYDDVIISTLPRRTSVWLRRDLARRARRLGVPVTVIRLTDDDRGWLLDRFKDFGPRVLG
jgi:hypothetical protein